MAVDTALKRFSATQILVPFRPAPYPAESGVPRAERRAAGWVYSGILEAKAAAGTPAITIGF